MTPSLSLPPPQSQGLDCSAEAWQRPRMGKVQGRQLTLPACLNHRVNLHPGHNGFSLARQLHTQAACQRPGSCSLTPFCLRLQPKPAPIQTLSRTCTVIKRSCLKSSFHPYFHILDPEAKELQTEAVLPPAVEIGAVTHI